MRSPDKPGHLAACPLEGEGRLLAELIDATMNIGVIAAVVVIQALDHLSRLLRRGTAVKEGQQFAVHMLLQDREIAS